MSLPFRWSTSWWILLAVNLIVMGLSLVRLRAPSGCRDEVEYVKPYAFSSGYECGHADHRMAVQKAEGNFVGILVTCTCQRGGQDGGAL